MGTSLLYLVKDARLFLLIRMGSTARGGGGLARARHRCQTPPYWRCGPRFPKKVKKTRTGVCFVRLLALRTPLSEIGKKGGKVVLCLTSSLVSHYWPCRPNSQKRYF